jgi:hypothetical protein
MIPIHTVIKDKDSSSTMPLVLVCLIFSRQLLGRMQNKLVEENGDSRIHK